jgi:hypothetical protein
MSANKDLFKTNKRILPAGFGNPIDGTRPVPWAMSAGYDPIHDILYTGQCISGRSLAKLPLNRWATGVQAKQADAQADNAQECSPNPFNPSTEIRFTVSAPSRQTSWSLQVFDLSGRLVRTLAKGEAGLRPLAQRVVWNAKDDAGQAVETGMYIYKLKVGRRVQLGKMIYSK